MDSERVRKWVQRHCVEEADEELEEVETEEEAKDEEADADEKIEKGKKDQVDPWEPPVNNSRGAAAEHKRERKGVSTIYACPGGYKEEAKGFE